MIKRTSAYIAAQESGNAPVYLAIVDSTRMRYMWGVHIPTDSQIGDNTIYLWDGSATAGDGGTFGIIPITDFGARILQFGNLKKGLTPQKGDIFASLGQTALPTFSLTLDNTDGYFSERLGMHRRESFLTKPMFILQGYEGLGYNDFINIFQGNITYEGLTLTKLSLRATSNPTLTLESTPEGGLLPLEDDGLGTMAHDTYAFASIYSVFLNGSQWVLSADIIKDTWSSADVIFELKVSGAYYNAIRMQFGIDASNHLYFTYCPDIAGDPSTTVTLTDTLDLSTEDFSDFQKVAISYNWVTTSLTFMSTAGSTTVTIPSYFDAGNYTNDTITVGDGMYGQIKTINFNDEWKLENDDPNAVTWEDTIGSLDLDVVDGVWVT